jgi:hypothetical protein
MVAVGGDYVIIGYFMGWLIAGPLLCFRKSYFLYYLFISLQDDCGSHSSLAFLAFSYIVPLS